MDFCSFADIQAPYDEALAAIAHEQGIDPICSSSNWLVPVAAAFSANARPHVLASDHGYAVLLEHDTPNGPVLSSFDAVWGFATPFVAPEPAPLVAELRSVLSTMDFYALTVSGLDPRSSLFDEVQQLGPVGYTDTADRCVADLSDGFDAWIGRRSPRFRRSLRSAASRGESADITVEHVAPADADQAHACFDRLLEIESKSWKTDASSGLIDTDLGDFTRCMAVRFAQDGRLRLQFAQLGGSDIGYVIGARLGDRYRGFQHSFDQLYHDLSVGKLLQFHTIRALADEGVQAYDMGMHMTYKESYADRIESTVTAIIPKR